MYVSLSSSWGIPLPPRPRPPCRVRPYTQAGPRRGAARGLYAESACTVLVNREAKFHLYPCARACVHRQDRRPPPPHAARKSKWNASTRNNTKARFLMSFHEEFVLLVSPFVLHWMRHRREVHSYLRLPATWFIRKSINLIESSLEQLSRVTRSAK